MADPDNALLAVQAELAELESRRRSLVVKRGQLVRSLVEERGWKFVAQMLGVGHSRVYAMSAQTNHSSQSRMTL